MHKSQLNIHNKMKDEKNNVEVILGKGNKR